jgi:hypothetical protein
MDRGQPAQKETDERRAAGFPGRITRKKRTFLASRRRFVDGAAGFSVCKTIDALRAHP